MSHLQKIFSALDKQQKRTFYGFLVLILIHSTLEAVGVASILPFIGLVSNPQLIQEQMWLAQIYLYFQFETTDQFITYFGISLVIFFVFKNIFTLVLTYLQSKYWRTCEYKIGSNLLKRYLYAPYTMYLKSNSALLYRNITSSVSTMLSALGHYLVLISECTLVLFILGVLFYNSPAISLIAGLVISVLSGTIYLLTQKRLGEIGILTQEVAGESLKTASQAFSGIKDIKVIEAESYFITKYRKLVKRFANKIVEFEVLSALPRIVLETTLFVLMIGVVLWLNATTSNVAASISLLAMFAVAGIKLMPSLNKILSAKMSIRRCVASTDLVYDEFMSVPDVDTSVEHKSTSPMKFTKSLDLQHLNFSYDERGETLNGIELKISRGASIGIVGPSGSGKTTLVDIILGLLTPQSGSILVDNEKYDPNSSSYKKLFGYVPQTIYLTDDSILHNIALGESTNEIDVDKVKAVTKLAHLDQFIEELPELYDTKVGERGVRISGGQRQRIGIARALYRDPQILILDEATSSLDSTTERHFLNAIQDLKAKKTLITIAHRISTVIDCDVLYLISRGKISYEGSHQHLFSNSKEYQELCRQQNIEP